MSNVAYAHQKDGPGAAVQRTRTEDSFDSVDAAKAEGERWMKEGAQ